MMAPKEYALLCIGALLVYGSTAVEWAGAQQTSTSTGQSSAAVNSSDTTTGEVTEIVVTAQRKSERLQDVPISVTSVSAQSLESQGITDVFSLSEVVPGLNVTRVATVSTPYLRGIGSNGADPNNEASVATYVDGVYYAAPFGNLFSFNNIDRIEVLKGPQGTLFGRNATGGVIQIITKTPSETPSADVSVGYANFQTVSANAYATMGLAPNLAGDISFQYLDQGQGWGRNVTLGIPQELGKELSVRSKLLYTPTDQTKVQLTLDYANSNNSFNVYEHPKGYPDLDGVVRNLPPYDSAGITPSRDYTQQYGLALRLDQDVGFARFVSLSARRVSTGINQFDYSTSPVAIVSPVVLNGHVNTWSQEFQMLSPSGATIAGLPLDWTFGAFYFDDHAAYSPETLCGIGVIATGCFDIYGNEYTRSASAYAQTTVEVLPKLRLTGGFRWTHEMQSYVSGTAEQSEPIGGSISGFAPAPTTNHSFGKPTWRVALDYAFTNNLSVYVSDNRGIKSGGFDLASPGGTGYLPEILDAYEVGMKSELFERRVRLNLAVFDYRYKDIQVTAINNETTFTGNAARATIKGLDADLEVVATSQLRLTAGAEYLDGKFGTYPNPVLYGASGAPLDLANADDKTMPRAPKFTGNLGANYAVPVSFGEITASGVVSYNSGFFWEAGDRLRQPAYSLINAAVIWKSNDKAWGIKLWGDNLADKRYLSQGVSSATGDLLDYAAPRTYGVTLSRHF